MIVENLIWSVVWGLLGVTSLVCAVLFAAWWHGVFAVAGLALAWAYFTTDGERSVRNHMARIIGRKKEK
jgi:hypothetical protein